MAPRLVLATSVTQRCLRILTPIPSPVSDANHTRRIFSSAQDGVFPTSPGTTEATDAVISIVTSLAVEVWALQERIDSLESVLEANGSTQLGQVETHRPTEAQTNTRAGAASALTGRVFRVFEEMREAIDAGETNQQYRAVAQRAFDEL